MRRWLIWAVALLGGCSTHPVADFMDHFFPAKIDPNAAGGRNRGGVCDPPPGSPTAPNAGHTPGVPPVMPPAVPPYGMAPGQPAVPAGPLGLSSVDPPPPVR